MSCSIRRFWWSDKCSTRGWPLVAWDDICLPKAAGGIWFKDLHLFNIALLGKQFWRLLSAPGSLLYRTLRAKYFPDGDLFSASSPARSSFAWKGLHRAMLHLRDVFYWTLGIDSQVRLFRDRWAGFSPITLAGDSIDREEIPLRCREFMVPGQAHWDHAKLLAHLPPGDMDNTLEVPISSDWADTLVWGDHDSVLYTVRSGYLFLRRPPSPLGPPPRLWKILAKLPTIPKVRSSGWRCGREALPVGSRLRDAGLSDGACPLCGVGFEDVLHVLRDCPDSSTTLRQAGFANSLLYADQATVVDWLGFAASSLSLSYFALLFSVLWGLWRRRNTWVHERSLYPLHLVVEDAVLLCLDYASASASTQVPPPAAADPPIDAHHPSGAVLGGFAKPVPVHGPASTVEDSALFASLEFAIANAWPSALIESDAAISVNKLHRPTADLSLLGDMLAPSRALLAANAAHLRFGFASRFPTLLLIHLPLGLVTTMILLALWLRRCPVPSAGFGSSLLYRTLRAKYFPDGDLFSASAPARSSFAWKGLHRAMLRLRDGFYWTLGIDSQVRLFRDRWAGFSPITLAGDSIDREEIPLRCREFMVPGQARWDHAKLLAHLPPGDVDSTLEVPISSDRADTLVWGDHDSGLYTVRSGYLFLRRPPSPLGPPPRLWKILAKLPTIPKVRSFGWRCGREALPVGSRLRDAGLSDGACPLCGVGFEDVLHVLRDCPDSSTTLRQAGFANSLLYADQATVVDWLGFAASSLSLSSFALLLSVLWGLWRRRNTWVHERSFYPLHLVIEDVILLCLDYASASASTQVPPPAAADPPIGAHHPSGAVLGGFAKPVPVHGPASTMEDSALFASLEFVIANAWPSALIEFDVAVLVNKLHRPTADLSILGDMLAPSRALLAANSARLRFSFASRLPTLLLIHLPLGLVTTMM
ncbi:hypothetical protein GQ457_12G014260 [Hibiscus cannabinus]